MVLTSCNYRKRLLWHSRHVPAWRKTYYADALKPRKIKHSGRQCIKERQKLTFLDIFENAHVDTRYRNPDNPFSLRCSNCFLIVSPLFLLCRLGAGRKAPRIFFTLPVPSLCKNIKNHCDTDISSHWRRSYLRQSTARHASGAAKGWFCSAVYQNANEFYVKIYACHMHLTDISLSKQNEP
ncbi:hypothetical protein [Chromobacterium violaceum]|uniref:hypothetical protein n=1 Tax=Chromobacterium violaceum TaxID=536 RepID=UPI0012FE1DF3|nr:hypothetical protein [Chromobacterium violaceum]